MLLSESIIDSEYIELADTPHDSDLGAAVSVNGDLNLQEITDQTSLLQSHIPETNNPTDQITDHDSPKSEPLLSDKEQLNFPSNDYLIQNDGKSPQKVYREVILVTIAVFMGYASLSFNDSFSILTNPLTH